MRFSYWFCLRDQPLPGSINDDSSFITWWEHGSVSIATSHILLHPQRLAIHRAKLHPPGARRLLFRSLPRIPKIFRTSAELTIMASSPSGLPALHLFTNWLKGHTCSGAQSCPILCDPMDCSPPGSSVHGILQARILEWAAMPFSGLLHGRWILHG